MPTRGWRSLSIRLLQHLMRNQFLTKSLGSGRSMVARLSLISVGPLLSQYLFYVLPPMILYDTGSFQIPLSKLCSIKGSVLPRALLVAIPASLVSSMVCGCSGAAIQRVRSLLAFALLGLPQRAALRQRARVCTPRGCLFAAAGARRCTRACGTAAAAARRRATLAFARHAVACSRPPVGTTVVY